MVPHKKTKTRGDMTRTARAGAYLQRLGRDAKNAPATANAAVVSPTAASIAAPGGGK